MKRWCPRCDQGWVVRCRVRGESEIFLICDECDTVWTSGEPHKGPPYLILHDYMKQFGKEALWTHLDQLDRNESR